MSLFFDSNIPWPLSSNTSKFRTIGEIPLRRLFVRLNSVSSGFVILLCKFQLGSFSAVRYSPIRTILAAMAYEIWIFAFDLSLGAIEVLRVL
ncbi:hypothetical protein TorRG33x02_065130 [Trema orientale]|uniref:Uncharacterized protein n=1 Tax=Trema orientale TaxID=63057 RepID=A0A2P5FIK6_TREOI|nr:hypothetical protein TorRG33x02_065130 [Trema orientale]